MSSSNSNPLQDDLNHKDGNDQRSSARDEELNIAPEILGLINSISDGPTPPQDSGSFTRQMPKKGKGKSKNIQREDYDSDASSAAVSFDELVTEPNGSTLPSHSQKSEPGEVARSISHPTPARQTTLPSSASISYPALPTSPSLAARAPNPSPAPLLPRPNTQSPLSPIESPINPRFSSTYLDAPASITAVLQSMMHLGDAGFRGPSQNGRPTARNAASSSSSREIVMSDPIDPFTVPPTPATATTTNSTTVPKLNWLNSVEIQEEPITIPALSSPEASEPDPVIQQSNTNFYNTRLSSTSRSRSRRQLTREDLDARLDEDDDFSFLIALPPRSDNRQSTGQQTAQIPANPPSSTATATAAASARRQSLILDHGDDITIFPEDYDDFSVSIIPEERHDNNLETEIYNPYATNRQSSLPWDSPRQPNTNRTGPGESMNYVPPSMIDHDAALRIFQPSSQHQNRAPTYPPRQASPHPARSRTPGLGRAHSVDDDCLLAIQLAEEQRHMVIDQAVAMYLMQTQEPLDDCSFDNLVTHGLISRDVLDILEQLDTTALQVFRSSPLPSPVPSPAPESRRPTLHTGKEPTDSTINPSDKGKSREVPYDNNAPTPLFRTNINQVGTSSPDGIDVFIQVPTTSQAPLPSDPTTQTITSKCGICFETFQLVDAPRKAASLASFQFDVGKGKNVAVPFDTNPASEYGAVLSCSRDHGFCIDCLTQYVKSKLQDGITLEGKGFPIRCPGCSSKNAQWEVDDDLAERVLDAETLEFWRRQKLLLSLPGMIYCPNSRCSELLAPPEDLVDGMATAAECPSCTCSLCFQCGFLWHPDLTCKENEALKEHEDKEIYIMAKKQQWRRCPKCKMVVEKTEGCHHMTCRCGYEFCWLCGKVYGGMGCAGNCGQWISDPNVVGLPTPGYDADQGGPSTVHVNNSSRSQPQTSPAPGPDNPSGGIDLPPWSRP